MFMTNTWYELIFLMFAAFSPFYAAITEIITTVVSFLIVNRLTPVHIIIKNVFSPCYGTLSTTNVDYLVATSVQTALK